jgi:hypothetical protein
VRIWGALRVGCGDVMDGMTEDGIDPRGPLVAFGPFRRLVQGSRSGSLRPHHILWIACVFFLLLGGGWRVCLIYVMFFVLDFFFFFFFFFSLARNHRVNPLLTHCCAGLWPE